MINFTGTQLIKRNCSCKAIASWFWIFCFSLVLTEVTGQVHDPNSLSNIIPASPEVASLQKFTDIPVSYSTGVPDITIPLYTVASGDISVPITLSYNASGIRVEEASSWVGLGWNLSTGPTLYRAVRGLPDDFGGGGYMYNSQKSRDILTRQIEDQERVEYLREGVKGELDLEPDIFHFSAFGYSGKFYYDQDSADFIVMPFQQLKVEYKTDGNGEVVGWILHLPNGIKCFFGQTANNVRIAHDRLGFQSSTQLSGSTVYHQGPVSSIMGHINNWHILEIQDKNNKNMQFFYRSWQTKDFGRGGESIDYRGASGCDAASGIVSASYYWQDTQKSLLEKITTDISEVNFILSATPRQDVVTLDAVGYLEKVVIKSAAKVLKQFKFNSTYTISADAVQLPGLYAFEQVARTRLFLNSLVESDGTGVQNPPYKFLYDSTNQLPSRLSASQDYWGYYNGKSNGINLMPKILTKQVYGNGTGFIPGADRTVDLAYAKAGVLSKIEYPTGGSTEYYYESNTANPLFVPFSHGMIPSGLTTQRYDFIKDKYYEVNSGVGVTKTDQVYTDTVYVGQVYGDVELHAQTVGCMLNYDSQDCPARIVIEGINGTSFYYEFRRNLQESISLPEGAFKIFVYVAAVATDSPRPLVNLSLTWLEMDPETQKKTPVGGLRVKKIVSRDGSGSSISRSYDYSLFNHPTISSGQLPNSPVYTFKVFCAQNTGLTTSQSIPMVSRVVSGSAVPLSAADGYVIRYTNITEYFDEERNSYKVRYTYSSDFYNEGLRTGGMNYPIADHSQRDWRSRLLESKQVYEKLPTGLHRIVQEEVYTYKEHRYTFKDRIGASVAFYPGSFEPDINGHETTPAYGLSPYSYVSEWYLPDSVISSTFSYHNGAQLKLVVRSKSAYNNHYALSKQVTSDSEGKLIVNRTWYPFDFSDTAAPEIAALKDKYLVGLPVRQETTVNGKLTTGQLTKYDVQGRPIKLYTYESEFLADSMAFDKQTFIPTAYTLKNSLVYDEVNLRQVLPVAGLPKHYLWDYAGNYPVAEVGNADSLSFAYTSFEAEHKGNWNFNGLPFYDNTSPTGRKCYSLSSGSLTKGQLLAEVTYLISLWSKGGSKPLLNGSLPSYTGRTTNGWTYFEYRVSGVSEVNVSGNALIDQVRLHPVDAQMTTYTYDLLVGMTSSTDANGKTTYYEYDGFGRLLAVKDEEGQVLKTYQYHYKGQ